MDLEKNNRMNTLLEFYSTLLTKKQYDYIALYYQEDLSLGEIAEQFDVSRQAVYDNIRRTEKILEDYEKKLQLFTKYRDQNQAFDRLQNYLEESSSTDPKLSELLSQLKDELE